MHRPRFFRDPIHGQIRFNRTDLKNPYPNGEAVTADDQIGWLILSLINCKAFQRLRHTRQNGLANLVFHGMEHSRFSHSIGVSYLAGEMYDRVVRNGALPPDSRQRLAVVAAGLLHDIGHGPFSHSIEEVLNDLQPAPEEKFRHEKMTVRILLEDAEVKEKLSAVDSDFPEYVASYIDKSRRTKDHWTYRVVSSQLDADRLDYLMRDSRNAGLESHNFDLYRILDMLFPLNDERIVVDRHATEAIEAYLLTLEHAYRAIYFHRGIRGATVLLGSVLKRAAYLHKERNTSIFPNGSSGFPNPLKLLLEQRDSMEISQYVRLGEFHIWSMIEDWQYAQDVILSDLSQRLMRRQRFLAQDYDPYAMSKFQRKCEDSIAELVCREIGNPRISVQDALDYYVIVDDPERVGYKTYNWGASEATGILKDESIWLFNSSEEHANPVPIENETGNGIFTALKGIKHFNRMMFPHEVLTEVKLLPYFPDQ
jgi:HD superfamily phosphohydrolase